MYRMAMLAMCATDTSLDKSKSVSSLLFLWNHVLIDFILQVCHDVLGSRLSW